MAVWESSDRKTSRFLSTALQSFSKISSIFVILIGITVLLGWSFQIDFLKSVLPGSVAMKVNTALGLLLSGTALRLWHQQPTGRWTRLFGQASAIVVLLIGLLTLHKCLGHESL
jgi:xanthine/uracil permease